MYEQWSMKIQRIQRIQPRTFFPSCVPPTLCTPTLCTPTLIRAAGARTNGELAQGHIAYRSLRRMHNSSLCLFCFGAHLSHLHNVSYSLLMCPNFENSVSRDVWIWTAQIGHSIGASRSPKVQPPQNMQLVRLWIKTSTWSNQIRAWILDFSRLFRRSWTRRACISR